MDTNRRPCGIAVLGAGFLGAQRAAAASVARGTKLVAVVDVIEERARAVAGRYGAVAEPDLDAVLGRSDVDAVVVATPHGDHGSAVAASLSAGKHVLCEKPLSIDADEARALALDADRVRFRLATGFNHRFYPPVRDALKAARSGAIGRVEGVRLQIGHRASAEFLQSWHVDPLVSGGGTLADNGPHACDLAGLFLGEIVSASGMTSDVLGLPDGCESDAHALLRDAEGRVAEIHSSWTLDSGYLTIEVRGSAGFLRVDTAPWRLSGRLAGGWKFRRGYFGDRLFERIHRRLVGCERSIVEELEAFASPSADRQSRGADGWDGWRAAAIVRSIYESARIGEEIAIRPFDPRSKATVTAPQGARR